MGNDNKGCIEKPASLVFGIITAGNEFSADVLLEGIEEHLGMQDPLR
jgi:hypothetical protein